MAPAWRSLRLAAEAARVESVDDEYHALFIGVGRGELMPYGSWYLSGFLMERPLAVLRGALRSLGIERQSGVGEPEDHATALCETMSMIIESADEIGFATQQAFFNEHMAPWMGQFFLDMQTAESACFYREVGQFGEQFIKLEQHYFSMMA
ncbi:MAG: TorD/DmsD family molecular chaperone [Gammaproteobacteria bacterium]